MRSVIALLMSASLGLAAQNASPNTPAVPVAETSTPAASSVTRQVTVPAGTEVLLQLKSTIDTKNAQVGDGVYCQTAFPVTVENVIAIPGGTYVKGEIVKVQR